MPRYGHERDGASSVPNEETPLSPSKRPRDGHDISLSPSKRSRHNQEDETTENSEADDGSGQLLSFAKLKHNRLVEKFGETILEELQNTEASEICKAFPQAPARTSKHASVFCHLGIENMARKCWNDALKESEERDEETLRDMLLIRRVELASVALSLMQPDFRKLKRLHDSFLQIFGSQVSSQFIWALDLLHSLKAQLCLIEMDSQPDGSRDEIVKAYYPLNSEDLLRGNNEKFRQLSAAESQYLTRCGRTRDSLISYQSLRVLREKYQWQTFLRNAINHTRIEATCLNEQYEGPFNEISLTKADKEHDQLFRERGQTNADEAEEFTEDDLLTQAVLAAHAQERAHQTSGSSISTSEQLAKGRIAASSKPSQRPRDPKANQSHRRPWSFEEEDALLKGLDMVKGPFWSQILALFGERGSISTILKDRNQVQLKDKARNLKLFFLKNDQPVPKSLSKVTGDLKSRAPMYLLPLEELQVDRQPKPATESTESEPARNVDGSTNGNDNDLGMGNEKMQTDSNESHADSPAQEGQYTQDQDMADAPDGDVDDPIAATIRQAVAAAQEAELSKFRM